MQSRSFPRTIRLALAFLVAGLAATGAQASDDQPKPVVNTVKLDLQISGVGTEGCKVEIRPAHPGCKFSPVVEKIEQTPTSGVIRLDSVAIRASSLSADRDCAFAITITEPGADPVTFKRSVRLELPTTEKRLPELSQTFYLRSTVVASRGEPKKRP